MSPKLDGVDPHRLTVTRWRRFGHDRLYVSFDGAQVGWWDLLSGVPHPHTPHFLPALHTARAHWWPNRPLLPVSSLDDRPGATVLLPARDLATREPAAALLAKAAALEATTPSPPPAAVTSTPRPSAWRRLLAWILGTGDRNIHQTAHSPAPASQSWLVGAAGERWVADLLFGLTRSDPLWQSFHSIPVGTRGSDIDHLVLGPGGIFTINTKHHPRGRVWVGGDAVIVNGVGRPYVRNSRHEAARASRLLSRACGFPVPVQGLIVTVGAILTVKAPPADVTVLEAGVLPRWLTQQPPKVSISTLGYVFQAARLESTWQPPGVGSARSVAVPLPSSVASSSQKLGY